MNIRRLFISILPVLILMACQKEIDLSDSQADTFLKLYGNGIRNGELNAAEGFIIEDNRDMVGIGTIGTNYNTTLLTGIYVFRTDDSGFLKDEIVLTDSFPAIARDIVQAGDGGYYILGYKNKTTNPADVRISVFLARLSTDFSVTWQVDTIDLIGESHIEVPKSMRLSSQGDLMVLGNYLNSKGDSSVFLSRFDTEGHAIKTKMYSLQSGDISLSRNILEGMFASRMSFIMGFNDSRTAKPNPAILSVEVEGGQINDAPPFGSDNSTNRTNEIQKAALNNYLLIGSTDSTTGDPQNILLFKVDQFGKLIWEKIYGSEDDSEGISATYVGNSVSEAYEGGLIVLGTKKLENGNSDLFLVRTDGSGNVLWSNTLGGAGQDSGVEVKSMQDGFVIMGIAEVADTRFITFIKTDLQGRVIK